MSTTAAAEVEVDSSDAEQDDQAPPSRRRLVEQPSLGRGERARKVDLNLGGYAYTARCPKLVVWTDMASIIEEQAGSRRERRRAGDTERADTPRLTTDRIRLTQAMQHFLRGCLSAADWADLEHDLGDPDNDLDLPDLWAAGIKMVVEFEPDMREMAKQIGMKVPGSIAALAGVVDPATGAITSDEPVKAPAKKATAARKRAAGSKAR